MPCLSREPGSVLRWIQLRVDIGQKPVECPTTQPPLQLPAFRAVWLCNLQVEKDMGSKPGKLVPHKPRQYERNGGTCEEAEGLGQDCNGGRLICLERYRRYRVRYHLWREAWNQRDWKQYYPFSQTLNLQSTKTMVSEP